MGTTKQGGGMFSPQVEGLPAHFGGRSWRAYPRVRGYTQLIVQRGLMELRKRYTTIIVMLTAFASVHCKGEFIDITI
ncbi:Uncharacterised protein [Serratia fonticola]|uniref:Uncharacterized protein n=1 Tax=Serratia fonticola TaxID=47917 RepID=A0A4U9WCH2_SERFO|nr:Uncharacterised protein [Serratia fonticola]